MKAPAKKAVANVVIALGLAVVIFGIVILLVQDRRLSQEVKDQTLINHRFFRCLILIPPDPSRTIEERVALVDRCSIESFQPPSPPTSPTPAPPTPPQESSYSSQPAPARPRPVQPMTQPQPSPPSQPEMPGRANPPEQAQSTLNDLLDTVDGLLRRNLGGPQR